MARERQEDALLVLPHMRQLVDQQPLVVEVAGGEIVAVARAPGVEMKAAGRRHHRLARLEERPFAPHDAHRRIVDRGAEDRAGEGGLAVGERPAGRHLNAAPARPP